MLVYRISRKHGRSSRKRQNGRFETPNTGFDAPRPTFTRELEKVRVFQMERNARHVSRSTRNVTNVTNSPRFIMASLQDALLSTTMVSTTSMREHQEHQRRVRVCQGKARYRGLEDAVCRPSDNPVDFYQCGVCNGWHRTRVWQD